MTTKVAEPVTYSDSVQKNLAQLILDLLVKLFGFIKNKMSNFHAHLKSISRADGRSATGAIAYRSGEKIIDSRTGNEFDYTRKKGVEHSQIFFPKNEENTRPEFYDRQTLWNAVEKKETKSNAQVAREFEFSIPHELNAEQRKKMVNEFCKELSDRFGVVVDASIHAPHGKNADKRNYHAHVMFTTRRFENGQFTEKTREFSKNPYDKKELEKRAEKGLEDFSLRLDGEKNATELLRSVYERIGNKHLEAAGFAADLDRRSLEAQGIDRDAQVHEGAARQMSKRGLQSDRHDENQQIIERNKKLSELDIDIQASSVLVSSLDAEYDELRALQDSIQQQFFKNAETQRKAEKVLDMCLRPENHETNFFCSELIQQNKDLNNRFVRQELVKESIKEIVQDIVDTEFVADSRTERSELEAFTEHLSNALNIDDLRVKYSLQQVEHSNDNKHESKESKIEESNGFRPDF